MYVDSIDKNILFPIAAMQNIKFCHCTNMTYSQIHDHVSFRYRG